MGLWASTWYANLRLSGALKIVAIGGCAAANTMVFVCAPVYCSYGAVRRFESGTRNIVEVLPQIASPRETLIVGFDSHFLGYRHAGYYLPDYLTVQFPEVQLASGTRVFAMQDRDTRLESGLPATSASRLRHVSAAVGRRASIATIWLWCENAFPPVNCARSCVGAMSLQSDLSRISEFCFPAPFARQACARTATTGTPLVNSR